VLRIPPLFYGTGLTCRHRGRVRSTRNAFSATSPVRSSSYTNSIRRSHCDASSATRRQRDETYLPQHSILATSTRYPRSSPPHPVSRCRREEHPFPALHSTAPRRRALHPNPTGIGGRRREVRRVYPLCPPRAAAPASCLFSQRSTPERTLPVA
jgi:hypothetical protein